MECAIRIIYCAIIIGGSLRTTNPHVDIEQSTSCFVCAHMIRLARDLDAQDDGSYMPQQLHVITLCAASQG